MVLLSVLCVLSAVVTSSFSCHLPTHQTTPDSIERRVRHSDVVLAVRIRRRLTLDDRNQLYDVEAIVHCVYKRPADFPLSSTVTIQHVGVDRSLCFATNLTAGMEYIVFLSYDPEENKLSPSAAHKALTSDNMRYLASVCDTKLEIPPGVALVNNRCPRPQGGSNCRRFIGPTRAPDGGPPGTTRESGANMVAPSVVFLIVSSFLAAL